MEIRALSGAALVLERDFELDTVGQRLTFLDVNVLFDDTPHAQIAQAVLRHRDRGVGCLFPRFCARTYERYNLIDAFCHVLLPSPGACLTRLARRHLNTRKNRCTADTSLPAELDWSHHPGRYDGCPNNIASVSATNAGFSS